MEAQIYKEREEFKTTLLSVGDAIISTNKDGKINLMNNVAERLTGWSKEEAVNELKKYSGTQFDSNLVEIFIKKVLK